VLCVQKPDSVLGLQSLRLGESLSLITSAVPMVMWKYMWVLVT